jgi:hypothetical protein
MLKRTASAIGNFNNTDEIWELRLAGMKSFTGWTPAG